MSKLTTTAVLAAFLFLVPASHAEELRVYGDEAPVDKPADPPAEKPGEQLVEIGSFRPSFYWIAMEKADGKPKNVELLDEHGKVLVKVGQAFFKELRMEGTGKLLDGRMVNFKARVEKPDGTTEIRWRWCGPEAPFGYGFEDFLLREYRSVAVDPKVIPLGSRVYIAEAKGTKLPDGTIHDGYFDAVDIGSMITEKKIDIFTSFGDRSDVFEANGIWTGKFLKVFLVR